MRPNDPREADEPQAAEAPHHDHDLAQPDEEIPGGQAPPDAAPSDSFEADLDAIAPSQQVAELQDELLRCRAELENFRKRTRREQETERKYAAMPLLRDLIGVVDGLHRALSAAQAAGAAGVDELTQGVEMVASEMNRVLESHGCRRVDPLGTAFDPNVHEALAQQPSDEHPAGAVMLVHQAGYQLHDRVVRPAQVIVSSGPAS